MPAFLITGHVLWPLDPSVRILSHFLFALMPRHLSRYLPVIPDKSQPHFIIKRLAVFPIPMVSGGMLPQPSEGVLGHLYSWTPPETGSVIGFMIHFPH